MDIIKLKLDELNRLQSVRDDLKQFNIEVKMVCMSYMTD